MTLLIEPLGFIINKEKAFKIFHENKEWKMDIKWIL